MFVPRKPWPFGNEYHTVCCCSSGIMWGIDLVEGKDRPQQLGIQQYDNFGSTVGLLLRMLSPIYHKGFIVILASGFCVLKGIIELRKKGVFDRIPSTTPGAEPPRDAKDSGSARSHSTHLETSSSDRP